MGISIKAWNYLIRMSQWVYNIDKIKVMGELMKITNYEDMIMKRAMDIFAQEGLKFFGIHKAVKEFGPTELVVLESKNMFMDYTFLMEDDTYIHFEFQTTNKGAADLRRFRAYEALLSHQTGKDVVTYVIYSGDIINAKDIYHTGINKYKVKMISMVDKDGDKVFNALIDKIQSGKDLTTQDIIELTFTPIMGGKQSKVDKILQAIRLVKNIDRNYRYDVESILYAFANKFLDEVDLEKVKEEIRVTEIGRSLVEEGKKEKAIEIARELLDILSVEMIAKKTGLTVDEVEALKSK